jgi:hypothetical protein
MVSSLSIIVSRFPWIAHRTSTKRIDRIQQILVECGENQGIPWPNIGKETFKTIIEFTVFLKYCRGDPTLFLILYSKPLVPSNNKCKNVGGMCL